MPSFPKYRKTGKVEGQSSVPHIYEFRRAGFLLLGMIFWRSGNALNMLVGVRLCQTACPYMLIWLSWQRCDFAHLPPVNNLCDAHWSPSSSRAHDDSLFGRVWGLILPFFLCGQSPVWDGCHLVEFSVGRSAGHFPVLYNLYLHEWDICHFSCNGFACMTVWSFSI